MATAARTSAPSIRKVALASSIGTLVEYFDFFIFGTASALVFNKLFFPSLDPLAGTLASFATFGVAFFVRPLGGVVFGHFGDRVGRKTMLVVSLLTMGVGTAIVGLLPTYERIGIWAPILLVLTRMLQGAAVGGEWSGAVLMAAEHAPRRKRAFYSSWPQAGVPAGLVLATASFYLVEQLPPDAMMSWGWRVPFLASAVLVLIGLYIRARIEESPAFRSVRDSGQVSRFPAAEVLRSGKRSVLIAILSMAANSVFFYTATVFALRYASQEGGAQRGTVLLAVMVAALLLIVTMPITALLADRYGRRPVLLAGAVFGTAAAFPFFLLLHTGSTIAILAAMVMALPIAHSLLYTPLSAFMPELFETRMRYSGSAIGYQIGAMLFSGPTPFVATALFAWAGAAWPLALYLMFGAVLTLAGVYAARETYHDDLRDTPEPVRTSESPATTSA
ncbi:MFS transporter [Pseudonocardia acaciae]|uniref:MFS transporter n=1 Tax=Pseudonocardia acaciae TaxID=551276 RepID=UPI00056268E3|nr:MFS transporter [Pseudonocardia acaciae]